MLKLKQYEQEIASSAEEKPDADPIRAGKYELTPPRERDALDTPREKDAPDIIPGGGDAEVPDMSIPPGDGGGKVPPGGGPTIAPPPDDDGGGDPLKKAASLADLLKQVGGKTGAGRLGTALNAVGKGAAGAASGAASGAGGMAGAAAGIGGLAAAAGPLVAVAGGALALVGIAKQFKDMVSGIVTGGIEAQGNIHARIAGGITSAEPTGPAQALEGVRGHVEDVSKIVDPLGLNLNLDILNAQFKALADTVSAVDEGLKSLAKDLRGISPELATSGVEIEMMRLEGRLKQNEEIGQELADIEVSRVEFEENVREIKTTLLQMFLPIIQAILDVLNMLAPIIKLIATIIGWIWELFKKLHPILAAIISLVDIVKSIDERLEEEIGDESNIKKVMEDLENFRNLGPNVPGGSNPPVRPPPSGGSFGGGSSGGGGATGSWP